MYQHGVFNSEKCGTELDHAVTAVGFGTEDGKITTLSETLGEQLGVKRATLESLPLRVKESVEFNKFLSSQPLTEIGKRNH